MRDFTVPAGTLIIRDDNLVEHARRQAREYTYRNAPMYSISVSLTVNGWELSLCWLVNI